MDTKNFREFAKTTIDYVCDYIDNIRERPVLPSVEPGYIQSLIPSSAPERPEPWQEVLKDVERVIMPGMTHWTSPHFHAYYPTANSYPAIVGEILSASLSSVGFSWISGPACTELEVMMMNWLGKMLGLPEEFLNTGNGRGGGVIQCSASETTFLTLLVAKDRTVRNIRSQWPDLDESIIKSKLVAYTSNQSNSSVEKAGLLGSVPMRLLPTDHKCRLRGDTLQEAIEKDIDAGFIPCYVLATLGTTGTCAFDCLEEIGPICQKYKLWLHIDAAYAGAAFVCPEYRHFMRGVEFADSFNFNPHKWMLVNADCSAMWVKNSYHLINAFNVDRIYLSHDKQGIAPDYRHWQIPLGRRFRAMKLWFVLRIYGVQGIQNHIRKQIALAKYFEKLIKADERFEIVTEVNMGLVCFKIRDSNSITKSLLDCLMSRKNIYLVAGQLNNHIILRFAVCSRLCEKKDIDYAWNEIRTQTDEITEDMRSILKLNNVM